jgi:CopG family transcriptional regulator / antitoxin EndoAI
MHKRLNITLPVETIDLVDQMVKKGDRSRFIDEAIKRYLNEVDKENLREQLKEGYMAWAEQDLETAAEWSPLEEEIWQKNEQ